MASLVDSSVWSAPTVLTYKHSKQQADSFLTYLQNTKDIMLLGDSLHEEILFYKSIPHKISFEDAVLLFLATKNNMRLITFDKQLERIAKRHK